MTKPKNMTQEQEAAWLEKRMSYERSYREANKEKRRGQEKSWKESNKDKCRLHDRTYRKAHPLKRTEEFKAWRKANPEKDMKFYTVSNLSRSTGIPRDQVPSYLVAAKVAHLKLQRLIKELQHAK